MVCAGRGVRRPRAGAALTGDDEFQAYRTTHGGAGAPPRPHSRRRHARGRRTPRARRAPRGGAGSGREVPRPGDGRDGDLGASQPSQPHDHRREARRDGSNGCNGSIRRACLAGDAARYPGRRGGGGAVHAADDGGPVLGDAPMKAFSIRRFAEMLFRAAPRATVASLVLMVLVALTEGAGLLLLLPLLALAGVDTGGPGASGLLAKAAPYIPNSLGAALLLYVAIVAARAALEFAESVASVRVQTEVTRSLRERLYRALGRARWETIAPLRGARLAHVLTAELERVSMTTNQMLSGSLQFLVAIVYGVAALAISPAVALIAAAGALLLLIPAKRQQREARRAGDMLTALGAELFAGATEEVATLKVAKSAGIAGRMADRFSARARTHSNALVAAHRRYRASGAFLTAGAAAALAVVVYVAVARLELAPASLLLLLLVCARLVPRLAAVQSSFLLIARALPAAEAVHALLGDLEGSAEAPER